MPGFAARFRERMQLWRNTSTKSDPDPTDFTQDDGALEPAEVLDMKGGESVRGRTIEAYVNALVTMHYNSRTSTLRAKDKLICTSSPYENVTFNIIATAVKRVQGRPWLIEMDCTRNG